MSTHTSADRFVHLGSAINVVGLYGELFIERYYKSVTRGKSLDWGTATPFTNTGVALRPYSPAQLGGGRNQNDDVLLQWVRRTRVGGAWTDYSDVPLSEPAESYDLIIYTDNTYATPVRLVAVTTNAYTYTAAAQVTDFGSTQSTIYWTVAQNGTFFAGPQARGIT
jgi:hypothetical protein